ncbi:MAG TPA: DUF1937 family protein [Rhizobium sp.]|nr:DUF1937 family protein [Rhizobium sp.]
MIYLGSPYTHFDPAVREARYEQALAFTTHHMLRGIPIFSPIVHCHHMSKVFTLPGDFRFWQEYCLALLSRATELWVLQLEGWEHSVGLTAEVDFANEHMIPVSVYAPL